jgi:hypothetical protein
MSRDADTAFFVGIILICLLAFFLGHRVGSYEIKQEAVTNGHATWAVNATGNVTFQWKEASK